MKPINPRPGVVVCIARANGVIVRHDPGAFAREEWERHERRRRRAKNDGKNVAKQRH